MANSEWRVANGEWRMVSSEWRTVFLEGSAPALPKNFRHLVTSDAVVANRQSPIAAVFGSAGASPSQLIPSLVPRPTTRFKSAPGFFVINECGLKIRSMTCFRLRHQHGLKFAARFVLGCDIASELGNPQRGFCQLGSVVGTI
jgi:hypothetical protein